MTRPDVAEQCTCGHQYRHHFGPGPCLAKYVGADGKERASVCPCDLFTAAAATYDRADGAPQAQGSEVHASRLPAVQAQQAPGDAWERAPTLRTGRPPARAARQLADSAPAGCTVTSCKDPATVTVEKNGRAYCRPHGLAEALRRPRCDITPLPSPLPAS